MSFNYRVFCFLHYMASDNGYLEAAIESIGTAKASFLFDNWIGMSLKDYQLNSLIDALKKASCETNDNIIVMAIPEDADETLMLDRFIISKFKISHFKIKLDSEND